MKKTLTSIALIGIIGLATMGFQSSSSSGNGVSGGTLITLVKGQVINGDKDKYWEQVTFGLTGFNPDKYDVYVNILDKKGHLIGVVDNFDLDYGKKTSWFAVDLESFHIFKDFFVEVHVIDLSVTNASISALAGVKKSDVPPIDPEETILIVKYP